MARQVTHYSTFLTTWASLVGIPADRISTEIAAAVNASFNTAISGVWQRGPWLEVCPYGEARFVGNRLSYCNNVANSTYWTATAVTPTGNATNNPLDGLTTASKVMETAATSAHKVVQSVTQFFPSTNYTISCYARANGRGYIQMAVNDGATTYSAFYNLTAGTVGTQSNTTTATIGQQPNGFWLCQFTFTSSAAATSSGSYTVSISTDGSTLSYAGDTSKGVYLWGNLVQQTGNVSQNELVIAWDQLGESPIETVFEVYRTSPMAATYPPLQAYQLTPQGIQVINGNWSTYYINGVNQQNLYGAYPANPVFVYYRKQCPSFTGDTFDATATYAVDDQVYFTNSSGYGDFYKCTVATSAGQSPDTNPTSWEVLPLYQTFLDSCVYYSFADWLTSDGQMDKANAARALSQAKVDDQFDMLERQMGQVMPWKVATHVTARASIY